MSATECPNCLRPLATDELWGHADGCTCAECCRHCWDGPFGCHANAVESLRAALAARDATIAALHDHSALVAAARDRQVIRQGRDELRDGIDHLRSLVRSMIDGDRLPLGTLPDWLVNVIREALAATEPKVTP